MKQIEQVLPNVEITIKDYVIEFFDWEKDQDSKSKVITDEKNRKVYILETQTINVEDPYLNKMYDATTIELLKDFPKGLFIIGYCEPNEGLEFMKFINVFFDTVTEAETYIKDGKM